MPPPGHRHSNVPTLFLWEQHLIHLEADQIKQVPQDTPAGPKQDNPVPPSLCCCTIKCWGSPQLMFPRGRLRHVASLTEWIACYLWTHHTAFCPVKMFPHTQNPEKGTKRRQPTLQWAEEVRWWDAGPEAPKSHTREAVSQAYSATKGSKNTGKRERSPNRRMGVCWGSRTDNTHPLACSAVTFWMIQAKVLECTCSGYFAHHRFLQERFFHSSVRSPTILRWGAGDKCHRRWVRVLLKLQWGWRKGARLKSQEQAVVSSPPPSRVGKGQRTTMACPRSQRRGLPCSAQLLLIPAPQLPQPTRMVNPTSKATYRPRHHSLFYTN